MSQRNVKSVPGWTEVISQWLIHHAAARAPQSLSQRLEEEWLADLIARSSAMSRLRFAIGCCWATQVIALEYQPLSVPVTGAAVSGKHMGAFTRPGFGNFSSRSSTLFLVVSLHALVFYALLTAIVHKNTMPPPGPLVNRTLIDPAPPEVLPRLPPPTLDTTIIHVPKPENLAIPEPDQSKEVAAEAGGDTTPSLVQPPRTRQVVQVQGGPGVGFPNPDDFYPAAARRLEEQGIATVRVCVDGKGRLTADPTTVQGTGSVRLDEGALKLARAGSGHYRATTEDGQPVSACYPLRIRFQLRN